MANAPTRVNFFKVIAAQSAYSTQFTVPVVGALIGIVILFFGRKLFWLCVAAVGFLAGIELAPHLVTEPSPLLQLGVALVLGLLGTLLALLLQKIAIAVVGFLAGGKLAGAIAAAGARRRTCARRARRVAGVLTPKDRGRCRWFSCRWQARECDCRCILRSLFAVLYDHFRDRRTHRRNAVTVLI